MTEVQLHLRQNNLQSSLPSTKYCLLKKVINGGASNIRSMERLNVFLFTVCMVLSLRSLFHESIVDGKNDLLKESQNWLNDISICLSDSAMKLGQQLTQILVGRSVYNLLEKYRSSHH